jgi:hypothetical protein
LTLWRGHTEHLLLSESDILNRVAFKLKQFVLARSFKREASKLKSSDKYNCLPDTTILGWTYLNQPCFWSLDGNPSIPSWTDKGLHIMHVFKIWQTIDYVNGVSFYIWTKKGTQGELDWSSFMWYTSSLTLKISLKNVKGG